MNEALGAVVREVVLALAPLIEATHDTDKLLYLLARLGWTSASAPQPLVELAEAGSDLLALVGGDLDDGSTQTAFDAVRKLVQALDRVSSEPDSAFPSGLDVGSFRATIGADLLDYLLVEHVLRHHYRFGAPLLLAGLIRLVEQPAVGARQPYLRRQVMWSTAGDIVTDPIRGFREAFDWNSAVPRLTMPLGALGSLLEEFGLQFSYFRPVGDLLTFVTTGATDPAEDIRGIDVVLDSESFGTTAIATGLKLLVLPATASRGPAMGLLPYANLKEAVNVAITDTVTLSLQGDADFTKGMALILAPGRPLEVHAGFLGGAATSPARVGVDLRIGSSPDQPEQVLLGDPDGSRLAVRTVTISAGSTLVAGQSPEVFVGLQLEDLHAVVKPDPDSTDSFIASVLGDDGLSAQLSLGLRLSSTTGFHVTGAAGLQVSLPVQARLGPVAFEGLSLGLVPNGQEVELQVGALVSAAIGPVSVLVDGAGFKLKARFPDRPTGNLGPLDVSFGVKPPSGIGLALDASGVVGGGVLFHDPQLEAYAGVLQLTLEDELTLTAYGLIATRLPDGSRGYSLLIFITAEGFQPVPLGFGFQLVAIGGMVAVHRTFDQAALTAGLRTDALAKLLLPHDPLANVAALMQSLATMFPAQRGSYLLGVLARITWFTPTLVELDLALILELGARTRLLVLGRASARLPSRDNDLLRLQVDALGVLDLDEGTLACDAVLVDSRLAHQFPITGSAALRARWPGSGGSASGAAFVLAVGGLNPHFTAPLGLPALERVTIALCSGSNPRLLCDAYLGITADTVQFGSRTALYAEALGFSVTGELSFDALITLLPPRFIVDFHASVQLKRGSHNLFKVTLDGTIEGPLPLRLAALASFEILWISFSVHFDFTLAEGAVTQAALPAVALADAVARALADPASWSTRRPAGLGHGVALRGLPPNSAHQVLDPLGQLVVRQQVAPLNTGRDIETLAGAPLSGARRFLVAASLNGLRGTAVQGGFAPARYFSMSDDEKLAAPPFEQMDAGVVLGAGEYSFDAGASVAAPLTYESIVLNPPSAPPPPDPSGPGQLRYVMPLEAFHRHTSSGAAGRGAPRRVGRARFRNPTAAAAATLSAPRWRIVHASDGTVRPDAPGVRTWSEHRATLATLNRGDAHWLMVPVHELGPLGS